MNAALPIILDGKALSKAVAESVSERVTAIVSGIGRPPGLAVILVGDNPASKAYVASKQKLAKACGLKTLDQHLPAGTSANDVLSVIRSFNANPSVDGILLQLPVPKPLDGATLVREILPIKDADGLHPVNQGLLLQGQVAPRPCTPLGVMALLDSALASLGESKSLAGKSAVIIGRSQLVGKPMAFLLLERNATVTIAHSKTPDLPSVCRAADIIVAAVGVPQLVRRDWVKSGAIVLDVGINRLDDGRLVGDVAFDEVAPACAAITPVPGGVGPMTVAMLISNTVDNCMQREGVII